MCHIAESVRIAEFDVVFVDGVPQGAIAEFLRNINGYGADHIETVSLKYVCGLHGQMGLWKQLCWSWTVKIKHETVHLWVF